MQHHEVVPLQELGGGAASELFEAALAQVVENIEDPNTERGVLRKVTLELKIKPGKDPGSLCTTEISCIPKLAPVKPFESHMFVGVDRGKARATEYNPNQGMLFGENEAGEKVNPDTGEVVDIKSARK